MQHVCAEPSPDPWAMQDPSLAGDILEGLLGSDESPAVALARAITKNDRATIDMIVSRHGINHVVTHQFDTEDESDTSLIEFSGGPAYLAALLGNDETAAYLASLDPASVLGRAQIDRSFSQGWTARTISLVELAIDNRLPALFKVVMAHGQRFDWGTDDVFDGDYRGGPSGGPLIIQLLFKGDCVSSDIAAFVARAGRFCGVLNGLSFDVKREGDCFLAQLMGTNTQACASMEEAIRLVKTKAGYTLPIENANPDDGEEIPF